MSLVITGNVTHLTVMKAFKPLCCPNYFHEEQHLEIIRFTSKNRVTVAAYENTPVGEVLRGTHNVKFSTLKRCCVYQ